MAERVFDYANEPVRAVRVVARIGNKVVAQTPIRHMQAPDGPVISFQRRWLIKRDPSLANATFHLVPASHVETFKATELIKRTSESPRIYDSTEAKSKAQAKAKDGFPIIPNWIRDFRCPGWTNVFQLVPNNKHLYGTETLFGDGGICSASKEMEIERRRNGFQCDDRSR